MQYICIWLWNGVLLDAIDLKISWYVKNARSKRIHIVLFHSYESVCPRLGNSLKTECMPRPRWKGNVCQLDSVSHWSDENILELGSGYDYEPKNKL